MPRAHRCSRALLALALFGCGGAAASNDTPTLRAGGAEPASTARAPAFLANPWAAWTANPAYADVELPFVMGLADRPCDAEYRVGGYPRIDVRYRYEPRRIEVSATPGELFGEGHVFCLPNPPFLAALELSPLVWTWELDERGRVVGRTIEDETRVRSRARYVWEGDRWTGVAFDDGAVQPVEWDGDLIISTPRADGGRTTFGFDGEARLVDRRTEGPDGALTISQYVHEEHSPRLVEMSFANYADPDGDPSSTRRAAFELDDDGRPVRCSLADSESDDAGMTVRYAYDAEGRLLERRAVVVDEYEGQVSEEEAWAWSYRYDCSEPRPREDDEE
jgi:YD repeat-containing protein